MHGLITGTFENSFFYYLFIYLVIFLLYRFWALQILPPLKIISSSRFVRKRDTKDWFVIWLLVSNWFKNPESHIFFI
jgi:hypothetical protein